MQILKKIEQQKPYMRQQVREAMEWRRWLRVAAQVISIVGHPLLMLTYMLILLMIVNPFLFGFNKITEPAAIKLILQVFFQSFLIPAVAIALMRGLGFISSFEMRERTERIGPFIVTGIFYLWLYQNVKNSDAFTVGFTIFTLGTLIGLFAALAINSFWKISLHAIGVGGWVSAVAITMWYFCYGLIPISLPIFGQVVVSMNFLLMASIMLAGLVGTARLVLRAHDFAQLAAGFALGFLAQFIALKIMI
ncbi:MAG: hypothetical protein RL757_1633 [Bacteroidota bacterium]|jgi:hypothetical protein